VVPVSSVVFNGCYMTGAGGCERQTVVFCRLEHPKLMTKEKMKMKCNKYYFMQNNVVFHFNLIRFS